MAETALPVVRILDRYVAQELGPPFAISVGVLMFFLVIDRVYQLTDLVITKQVPVALVASLLMYLLPPLLSLTLPVALLLAVLVSCGRMTGDLEVAALTASGVSPVRLLRPFVVVGLVVTALSAWLTLVVNPLATGGFQQQLFEILQARAATGIQERDLRTAGIQINPRYNYTNKPDGSQEAELVAYQVTIRFQCASAISTRPATSSTCARTTSGWR